MLEYLETAFGEILEGWRCKLIEFGGEPDHVHLLVDIHPALDISVLINNLKTASARRTRNRFTEHLVKFYYAKTLFWHRATLSAALAALRLRRFAHTWMQRVRLSTQESQRQKPGQIQNRPLDPLLVQGWFGTHLVRGMRGQLFKNMISICALPNI
jgi:putative transposase